MQALIDDRIGELIAACDKDNDGKITREELMEATKKNPELLANW